MIPSRPAGRSLPLAHTIAETLRDDILSARARPGDHLRQDRLASRFGTSRIPVREALRQLDGEGLVRLLPNMGARVVRLDPNELVEIYKLRELLEPFAISLSAPQLSDEQLQALKRQVEEMESITQSPSPAGLIRFVEIDFHFHLASYAAAASPRLVRMVERLLQSAQPYRTAFIPYARMDIQHAEHRLLLEALERRDGDIAQRILEVHIRRTRVGFASHPEIFEAAFQGWKPSTR